MDSTIFSQSFRQSTSTPNLEANRKAPLNFLFRLYVSLGGGVNLSGIKPLISDVTVAHSVPGLFRRWTERDAKGQHRLDVRIEHNLSSPRQSSENWPRRMMSSLDR